jgi:hypothetical protein
MAAFNWWISTTVGAESGNIKQLVFRLYVSSASAAKVAAGWVWLSDSVRGAISGTAPSTWSWRNSASRCSLYSATTKKHYLMRLSSTGRLSVWLGYNGAKTWYVNTAGGDGKIRCNSCAFA